MISDPDALQAATQRLKSAINALEAAVDSRLAQDISVDQIKAAADALADDRAQLAARLDDAEHRSETLRKTQEAVSERIDSAIEAIRGLLDAQKPD
ncbi:MAG: DUF4164 family protein [Pseudomonadota bacterium]